MAKVILLSQLELPYTNIGSWTSMYNYYLTKPHKIDYIVCPEPETKNSTIEYSFAKNKIFFNRIKSRYFKKRYDAYLNALTKIIEPEEKYVIQIVDNFGIVEELHAILEKKYKRSNFYIQFFYHGFAPFYGNPKGRVFFEQIDEMVLLTNDSYKAHMDFYSNSACKFSIQHNAIDRSVFKPASSEELAQLNTELNPQNKTVFLWCSQDRPKKGLNFILDAWKRIYKNHDNIELWVIGAQREAKIDGVNFLGRIPNNQIYKYYQVSSIYLFPSLWQEGFGLSLIEALLCGNLCIASNNGGIPEVLNYGDYGVLIERPNLMEEWIETIENLLKDDNWKTRVSNIQIPKDKYNLDIWTEEMNKKIENAKISLS